MKQEFGGLRAFGVEQVVDDRHIIYDFAAPGTTNGTDDGFVTIRGENVNLPFFLNLVRLLGENADGDEPVIRSVRRTGSREVVDDVPVIHHLLDTECPQTTEFLFHTSSLVMPPLPKTQGPCALRVQRLPSAEPSGSCRGLLWVRGAVNAPEHHDAATA
jgi:hypothetical protein